MVLVCTKETWFTRSVSAYHLLFDRLIHRQPPLVILILYVIQKVSPALVPIVFVLTDVACGILIHKIARAFCLAHEHLLFLVKIPSHSKPVNILRPSLIPLIL